MQPIALGGSKSSSTCARDIAPPESLTGTAGACDKSKNPLTQTAHPRQPQKIKDIISQVRCLKDTDLEMEAAPMKQVTVSYTLQWKPPCSEGERLSATTSAACPFSLSTQGKRKQEQKWKSGIWDRKGD